MHESTDIERNHSRFVRVACPALLVALLLLGGCAKLDPTSIEEARVAVTAAKNNANASTSPHMQDAERHLGLAEEQLSASSGSQQILDHESYLASHHARVAEANAAARNAQRAVANYMESATVETQVTRIAVSEAVERARALELEQTERGLVLTLGGVQFAFGSDELKTEAQLSVARLAGFLIALDDRSVVVEGHTDDVGTDEYNLQLSDRRASSVRALLIGSGVGEGRITSEGFGSARPVAPNDTDENRARNRRVEAIILNP